jgi:hypothetical protein
MISDIESVFKKNPNVLSIGGNFLIRKDMEMYKQLNEHQLSEINISEVPRDAFSASFVRKLVKYRLKDQFINVYSPYLKNEDKIKELYNSILRGFRENDPPKSSKKKAPAKSSTKKNAPTKKRKKSEVDVVYEDNNENPHPKRATRSNKEIITGGKRKRKRLRKTKRLRKH